MGIREPSYMYKTSSVYVYDTFLQLLGAFNICRWSSTMVGR